MRKNGVNRTLTNIQGGVCAPSGFRASGVYANIEQKTDNVSRETREDLGLILGAQRYPTACVFASKGYGAPTALSKKHIQSGYARAIVVNSGIANAFGDNAEKSARTICQSVGKYARILEEEVVIASTGKLSVPFNEKPVLENIERLVSRLEDTNEGSLAFARAIMTTDNSPKQFAYSFYIGDIPCKIGVACKGNARVCPNMATTLCFMTTDVNISPKMLTKALQTAVNDTLNMLVCDGISSPNDCACIMASGLAGNYIIDRADSEYNKFLYALKETLVQVCRLIALDYPNEKLLVCKLQGAKSPRVSKTLAKEVVKSSGIRRKIAQNSFDVEDVLSLLRTVEEGTDLSKVEIAVATKKGKRVLYEDGRALKIMQEELGKTLDGQEVEILIKLNDGNYQATAIGNDV